MFRNQVASSKAHSLITIKINSISLCYNRKKMCPPQYLTISKCDRVFCTQKVQRKKKYYSVCFLKKLFQIKKRVYFGRKQI